MNTILEKALSQTVPSKMNFENQDSIFIEFDGLTLARLLELLHTLTHSTDITEKDKQDAIFLRADLKEQAYRMSKSLKELGINTKEINHES